MTNKDTQIDGTQIDGTIPVITAEIPTLDAFHDLTGYTFSGVTLGSNPLYNNWSNSSVATTTRDKEESFSNTDDEAREDSIMQDGRQRLEESESILDFRITSLDGSEKRIRPGLLRIPSLRNSNVQPFHQNLPMDEAKREGVESALSSSECEAGFKRQCTYTGMGLTTGVQ